MIASKGKALSIIVLVLFAITVVGGYSLISLALEGYTVEQPRTWFSGLAFAIILFLITIGFLTGTYEISDTGVEARSIFGKHRLLFENVVEVKVLPLYGDTLLFGYNVMLMDFNGKNMTMFASYYANRHELVKAVMEGAKKQNPRVIIANSLTNSYGYPPYGLLNPKKDT